MLADFVQQDAAQGGDLRAPGDGPRPTTEHLTPKDAEARPPEILLRDLEYKAQT